MISARSSNHLNLIAAAVFLASKLVPVQPAPHNAGVSAVVALEQLSTVWRLALGALFFFTLAYILNSLGPAFLNLASGADIKDSPIIGRSMKELQKWHYKHLRDDVLKGSNRRKAAALWPVILFLASVGRAPMPVVTSLGISTTRRSVDTVRVLQATKYNHDIERNVAGGSAQNISIVSYVYITHM